MILKVIGKGVIYCSSKHRILDLQEVIKNNNRKLIKMSLDEFSSHLYFLHENMLFLILQFKMSNVDHVKVIRRCKESIEWELNNKKDSIRYVDSQHAKDLEDRINYANKILEYVTFAYEERQKHDNVSID